MRPIKLEMTAFGPYSGVEIIDFTELGDRNLFLITGPTGSGKTTIFDAISFAMYGVASGSVRDIEGLRSHFADENLLTEVNLKFELRGTQYSIRRVPKQKRPKARTSGYTEHSAEARLVIEDGDPKTIVTGIKNVNDKIEEVVGINADQFKQIMMIPQGEFRKLLTADSVDREKVLQKLFDTSDYRNIQEKLKEKSKLLYGEIKDKKTERDTHVENIQFVENEDFNELINAEDKLVHKVLEATRALIASDIGLKKELVNEIKKMDSSITKTITEKTKAKESNKNLEEKDSVQEIIKEQSKAKDQMMKKKEKYEVAEKALQLQGTEDNLNQRKKELEDDVERQGDLEKNLKLKWAKLEEAEASLQRQTSPEAEQKLEAVGASLTRNEGLESKVRDIEKLRESAENAEAIRLGFVSKKEANEESIQKNIREIKEKESQRDACQGAAVDLARLGKENAESENRGKVLKKVINICKSIDSEEVKVGNQKVLTTMGTKEYEASEKSYKTSRRDFLLNQAALLADELGESEQCPVCGSTDHPQLAKLLDSAVSQDELDQLEEVMDRSKSQLETSNQKLAILKEGIRKLKDDFGYQYDEFPNIFTSGCPDLEDERCLEYLKNEKSKNQELRFSQKSKMDKLEVMETEYPTLVGNLEKLNENQTELKELADDLDEKIIIASNNYTKASTELEGIYKEVPEELRSINSLMEIIGKLKIEKQTLQDNMVSARDIRDGLKIGHTDLHATSETLGLAILTSKAQLVEFCNQFEKKITAAGFASQDAYSAAKLDDLEIEDLKGKYETYRKDCIKSEQTLKDLDERTKGVEIADLNLFEEKLDSLDAERDKLNENLGVVQGRIKHNEGTINKINDINNKIGDQENRYKIIGNLSNVALGFNKSMMSFERYVLAAFLEDILSAANTRLQQMTHGRYLMSRSDHMQRKNKQSGLELEVFDNHTGRSRHVKTLSGGESFKASLAMALGLSDVVQSYAGGVQLDTMFIDEGFGTLDQESLDSAINCLIALQESGRLVGLISHVQELKERIDTRLEITTSSKGSAGRFVVG